MPRFSTTDYEKPNVQTLQQHMEANQEANYRRQLEQEAIARQEKQFAETQDLARQRLEQSATGKDPAALRLANEYMAARDAGDHKRANAIQEFAKTQEKSIAFNPTTQRMEVISGAAPALAELEGAKAYAKQQQELQAQAGMGYEAQPGEAVSVGDVAGIKQEGQELGSARQSYREFKAQIPGLERSVDRLNDLATASTYTLTGRARDAFIREFGFDPGDAAASRAEFDNIVKVTILPTLKATFGGNMSIEEGKWLLGTLGNPDLSPREKKSQIASRVAGWRDLAESKAASAGMEAEPSFEGYGEYGFREGDTQQPVQMEKGEIYHQLKRKNYSDEQIEAYFKAKGM